MTPLRAVTFDVGGTWLHVRPSVGHVYARVAAKWTGRKLPPERLNRRFRRAWVRRPEFDHSRAAWMELVDATFAGLVPELPSRTFFGELYRCFARPEVWRVDPAFRPVLNRLDAAGLRIGLISNWDLRLRPLLQALQLQTAFDVIVISAEIGFAKPSPAIFHHAADRLGLAPAEILHVGDEVLQDYHGARRAGLHAVLLRRGLSQPTQTAIASLRQLPAWIHKAGFSGLRGL